MLAVTQLGCSLVLDSERVQCSTDADCAGRGPAFSGSTCVDSLCQAPDPRWGCLSEPASPRSDPGPFIVTMHLQDLLNQQPLSGVKADVCTKVDVSCSTPRFSTASDDAGVVTLEIAAAFSGFVSFELTDALTPTLYFFNPPVDHDQEIPALSLSSPLARGALLSQLGASVDRGDILLSAFDCTGVAAADVTFALTPANAEAVPYYLVNGLPNTSAAATDSTGYGGFANLTAGTWTITGHVADAGTLPPLSLVVRGGSISWSRLTPPGF
jgi:hypothetical protein